jgi:hypothetical protein
MIHPFDESDTPWTRQKLQKRAFRHKSRLSSRFLTLPQFPQLAANFLSSSPAGTPQAEKDKEPTKSYNEGFTVSCFINAKNKRELNKYIYINDPFKLANSPIIRLSLGAHDALRKKTTHDVEDIG